MPTAVTPDQSVERRDMSNHDMIARAMHGHAGKVLSTNDIGTAVPTHIRVFGSGARAP
jgi:hypothetical protein